MLLSGAYATRAAVQVVVSGARGPSDYQLWLRAGNVGSYADYQNAQAQRVIDYAPGFKGDKGNPGGNPASIGLFTDADGLEILAGVDLVQTSGHGVVGKGAARYAFDAAVDAAYVVAHPRSAFRTTNGRGFRLVEPFPDVFMYGAVADGVTDDAPAVQACSDENLRWDLPTGDFFFGTPVRGRDSMVCRGAGMASFEPYVGAGPQSAARRTLVLVDGITAFDLKGLDLPSFSGVTVQSVEATQSGYGQPAGMQLGAVGWDISSSRSADFRGCSGRGLESIWYANRPDNLADSRACQMPSITGWGAADCGAVLQVGSEDYNPRGPLPDEAGYDNYIMRDPLIGEMVIALHCDRFFYVTHCDGIRKSLLRFFQARNPSVIRSSPNIELTGVCFFETSNEQLIIEDCENVVFCATSWLRAGGYKNGFPPNIKTALTVRRCFGVTLQFMSKESGGRAILIEDSACVSISGTINIPFWGTGYDYFDDGAIKIVNSVGVNINVAFGGGGYWMGVVADAVSQRTLSGSFSGDRKIGCVRAAKLQQNGGYVFRRNDAVDVGANGGVLPFGTARIFVEAGRKLQTRWAECSTSAFKLRVIVGGTSRTYDPAAEPGGAGGFFPVSAVNTVFDNSAPGAVDTVVEVTFALVNASAGALTVPAGTELHVSTAVSL